MKQEIDYFEEFKLNLNEQLKDFKPKEIMQVGYAVDNNILFTIVIPKKIFPFNRIK